MSKEARQLITLDSFMLVRVCQVEICGDTKRGVLLDEILPKEKKKFFHHVLDQKFCAIVICQDEALGFLLVFSIHPDTGSAERVTGATCFNLFQRLIWHRCNLPGAAAGFQSERHTSQAVGAVSIAVR